jgi:O-antigen ligase
MSTTRIVTVCEWLARISLLAVTVLLPWSFGGVDAFSQYLMFVFLLAAQACCLMIHLLRRSTVPAAPWVAAPAALFLLCGLAQTAPVNDGVLETLSPQALELRRQLLPAGDPADGPRLSGSSASSSSGLSTLSVYPPATRKEVSLLLCGLAALLMAVTVFPRTNHLMLLSAAVAINGAAVAYFGIVQQLSWNGKLYWVVPIEGSTPFGPFVNRNAAGGYLALCLSGAIPLLAWALTRRWTMIEVDAGRDIARRPVRDASLRPSTALGQFGKWADATVLAVIVVLGLLVGGLCAAMSRGAWLGAVAGLACALVVVGRSRFDRRIVMPLLSGLVISAALLAWLNLTAPIGDRLASVVNVAHSLNGRWELWQDVLRMVPDFWRCGSGLGTFGLVQPQYQVEPMLVWFDQAENLYLQALIEAGVPGCAMLIAGVVLSLTAIWPLVKANADGTTAAFAGMAVFAVCSQAVCAGFDFSLRYPANLLALALVIGGTVGRALDLRQNRSNRDAPLPFWRGRLPGVAVHALLLLGLIAASREIIWAGGVDLVLNRGQTEFDEQEMTQQDIDDELSSLQILLDHRPDDAEGHLRCAALYVVRYRQQALQQMQLELGPEVDSSEVWRFTSPMVLHQRAAEFAATGDTDSLAELRSEPTVRENLGPAVHRALLARRYGPLLCRAHQLLGQLCFLIDDPQNDAPHIARATQLVPQDPAVRYWAGVLHFQSDRLPLACDNWRR